MDDRNEWTTIDYINYIIGVKDKMSDWNVGDRVVDLPLWLVYEQKYVGTVRRLDGRRVYVEWDNDPGYEDLMYSDELKVYYGPQ